LSDKSYVKGFQPTSEDRKVFADLQQHHPQGPEKKFNHVYRWFNHVKTFPDSESLNWPAEPVVVEQKVAAAPAAAAPKKEEKKKEEVAEEEDDDDLFGGVSEEELAAQKKEHEEKNKKSHKPAEVQRSNIVFDVKPFDDETDLTKVEELVRGITMEGLKWGPSKLVDVAYGIKKLQISCVVVDDLVYTEDMEEQIMAFEDLVQSVDIASFTKV